MEIIDEFVPVHILTDGILFQICDPNEVSLQDKI